MQTLVLEEREEIHVPPMMLFRSFVDLLKCPKEEKIFIELMYLLAARRSELCSKVTPYEATHQTTKPYGKLLDWELQNYVKPDGHSIKVLLIKSAIAKQSKKKKGLQTNAVPQKLKVKTKIIPIVCDPLVEPWCVNILKWISEEKKLSFDFTGQTASNIIKRNLRKLDNDIHCHLLRHFRISHLIKNYNFSPYQIASYSGWSLRSVFAQTGVVSSSNLDIYAHLQWQDYIRKLLVPLAAVL